MVVRGSLQCLYPTPKINLFLYVRGEMCRPRIDLFIATTPRVNAGAG